MTNMTALLFSIALFITSCIDNSSTDKKVKLGDRLLEDPEHHIKDSPDILKHDSTILYTGWYYVVDTFTNYRRTLDKVDEQYFLDNHPILTAKNITTLNIYESNAGGQIYFGLEMRLDNDGRDRWEFATQVSLGKNLAFILDNRLLHIAKVNSQITNGVTALNRLEYSRQELENFKTIIESEK